MQDIKNIDDIKTFVDSFYTKIRADELLAPVFSLRVVDNDWERHLHRMYDFWNSVLFLGKSYKGNPFSKHRDLPISPIHFATWTTLFKQTIDEHFEGLRAEDTKNRADQMAKMFMAKLTYLRENPNHKSII